MRQLNMFRARVAMVGIVALSAACGLGCSNKNDQPTAPPVCSISPAIVAFDSIEVGSFKDTTITLTNVGAAALLGSLKLSQGTDFSVVGSADYALSAGQSDTFTVRFEPTNSGPFVCTISTDPAGCE